MSIDATQFHIYDVSHFPVCVYREDQAVPGFASEWIKEMELLIENQQPFVLVLNEVKTQESHDDYRDRGVWLKHNKDRLAQYCKGMITIESDQERRAMAEKQGELAAKAFGLHHFAVATLDEAHQKVRELIPA